MRSEGREVVEGDESGNSVCGERVVQSHALSSMPAGRVEREEWKRGVWDIEDNGMCEEQMDRENREGY